MALPTTPPPPFSPTLGPTPPDGLASVPWASASLRCWRGRGAPAGWQHGPRRQLEYSRTYLGTDLVRQLLAKGFPGLICIRSGDDAASQAALSWEGGEGRWSVDLHEIFLGEKIVTKDENRGMF